MSSSNPFRSALPAAALGLALAAAPAAAQEYWLIDDLSIEAGARSNDLDTTIRVDANNLDLGTTIDVEDVFGLAEDDDNVGVSVGWRIARRHLINGDWASYERSRERTIDREIQIGDTVFPIDVSLRAAFDIETIGLRYTYFPVLRERVAFGVGLGVRQYEFSLGAFASVLDLEEEADVDGPVPYLGIDYRYGISPRWRLRSNLGYFDIEIDDISGSLLVGEAAIEFKALEHLAFGLAGDVGQLDVELTETRWTGKVESDILGGRLFLRLIW